MRKNSNIASLETSNPRWILSCFVLFLAACLLSVMPVAGQNASKTAPSVSGTVVDSNGEIVVGASVILKGTAIGTTTDSKGRFQLQIPTANANVKRIVVSFLGMEPLEAFVGTNLKLRLESSATLIDELVVVGYGTQKKASLSGAISTISNKDIMTTKAPSLAVALSGKIPGLNIKQSNGMPGTFATDINMRGMGTPLIVIDGVVRHETTEFQKLSPDDIESITVLKDASAAIYGIGASNGAILVTTKAGVKGPLHVSLNALFGVSSPTRHTEMMDVSQYWEIRNEDGVNSGGDPYFSSRDALEQAKALPYTNWYDEVFKKSTFQQQYNLIFEGGNDKISTYTSVGYNTDNGLLKTGDVKYEKFSFRNGTVFNVNKNLRIDVNLSGYTDRREQPGTWDDAFFYLNKAAHGIIPSETVFANNDPAHYNRPRSVGDNPVQFSNREQFGYGEWRDNFFQSTMALTYSLPQVPGLKFKVNGAYDAKGTTRTRVQKRAVNYVYSESTKEYTEFKNMDPSIQEEHTSVSRLNLQGHIIYGTTIAKNHNINVVAVAEMRENNNRYLSGKRYYEGDFFTIDNIDRAPEKNQEARGNTSKERFMSFVGRLNYDFKGKYLVEFAFREDGSYRYHPDQRWGFFPVVSAAWRLSEESFIKNNVPFINNLKIRGSYGKTGSDAGNPFQYIPGYNSTNGYVLDGSGNFTNGYQNAGLLNGYLTWVTSKTADIGIDVGMWNGMLELSFDLYRRDREGLLADRYGSLPNIFGATLPQENLNSDRTEGFDLMIGHRNTVNEFTYGVNFNFSFNRSKTIYAERAPFRSSRDRWKNGSADRWHDIGWGYQYGGQYQSYEDIRNGVIEGTSNGNAKTLPGDYIHVDVNGDGIISDMDTMPIFWNGKPKINYGLTIYASWKGIDFNMLWQGAGMYTVKYGEILGNVLALDASNSPSMYYDRWHREDVYDPNSKWIPGKYPATRSREENKGSNSLETKVQRINAAYARLKNLEVGYTFPSKMLRGAGISKLRLYVNLTNPLVICNSMLKSFDPEISDGNGFQYPLSKSYNFGINLTF